MPQTCINRKCNRTNPDEAAYCYFDGVALPGVPAPRPALSGAVAFPSPMLLPSGDWCHSFDDLLRACQKNWSAGVTVLQSGQLAEFFGQIGRGDLAYAARTAAGGDDIDVGLNDLLALLPSQALPLPRLQQQTPTEVEFPLEVGQNKSFDLRLANSGARLLCGVVQTDCPWLSLGDGSGPRQDFFRFKFQKQWTLPIQVRGGVLGACANPYEGRLEISSNGGDSVVVVRVRIAPRPLRHGVFAGAAAPRDLVARVRQKPLEAAAWFENGAVLSWYRANNWDYPVPEQARAAEGLDAVRQFFSALGLDDPIPPPPPDVPASPFEHGVLKGARTPEELIERVRRAPREAADWFQNGAVARWYAANGWDYPVQGPAASGLNAVRQFFHALGLPDRFEAEPPPAPKPKPAPRPALKPAPAPKPKPAPPPPQARTAIQLHGAVGQSVMHKLMAKPRGQGGRPFSARATSDQTWLRVGATQVEGTIATIPLVVDVVPNRPGETLPARINLTLNDTYHTELLVTLTVEPDNGEGFPR